MSAQAIISTSVLCVEQLAKMESSAEFREEIRIVLEKDAASSLEVNGIMPPQTW